MSTSQRNRTGNVPELNVLNLRKDNNLNASLNSSNIESSNRKRGKGKIWNKIREFESGIEADCVRESSEWAFSYGGNSLEGRYVILRCAKSKQKLSAKRQLIKDQRTCAKRRRVEEETENTPTENVEPIGQCGKSVKLLYCSDSQKVLMYENEEEHSNHHQDLVVVDEIRALIVKLFDMGITKPSSVLSQLRNQVPPLPNCPSKRQLYYEISKIKTQRYGSRKISLKELNEWLELHSKIPEDEDEPFVVKFESGCKLVFNGLNANLNDDDEDDDDEEDDFGLFFRFFVSTKRLLRIAKDKNYITTDATYKLLWLGFPVLIVGTTCKNCNYHPYGIGLASNEKTKDFKLMFESIKEGISRLYDESFRPNILQADAARTITRGSELAFEYESENDYIEGR
jgi:hypothetical protein